jgi:hypothetical protein
VDLPTYTNIWRIEKRLYKLYDFRLPMPLPVGQIAVFATIAVPYVVALTLLGLPFSHTLLWLYVLPPGALAWLATRPVLESKRLPELVISQLRYLGEPRTWCRMGALAEKDEITVTCRVWRRADAGHAPAEAPSASLAASSAAAASAAPAAAPRAAAPAVPAAPRAPAPRAPWPGTPGPRTPARRAPWPGTPAPRTPASRSAPQRAAASGAAAPPAARAVGRAAAQLPPAEPPRQALPVPASQAVQATAPVPAHPAQPPPSHLAQPPHLPQPPPPPPQPLASTGRAVQATPAAPTTSQPAERPAVTVTSEQAAGRPLRVVERALNGPSAHRGDGWRDHVVVVPGGHRPGRPDQPERDRARARLPVAGSRRIVVLGCTVGAGQTMTTLMTAEVLASLRDDPVAVLDLNPGSGSLTERAKAVPGVSQHSSQPGRMPGSARDGGQPGTPPNLEVITRSIAGSEGQSEQEDVGRMFELVSARYPLTLADPAASAVPRVLAVADQLVLVAPASADAASAIAMTQEWLEAHGRASLAASAITVLNGVSRHTMRHVEQAEAVASGRCRAIIRVPWDDRLKNPATERTHPPSPGPQQHQAGAGQLSPAAVHAYTALAGVLIAGLAEEPELRTARI